MNYCLSGWYWGHAALRARPALDAMLHHDIELYLPAHEKGSLNRLPSQFPTMRCPRGLPAPVVS